jgi:phosphoglycolate phosphatase-like HAD superfamily hydrolase
MNAIAFDFDGVICNSSQEVFQVGLRTYAQLEPNSTMTSGVGGGIDDAILGEFARLTPLGNRAEDFGVALRAIEGGITIQEQADYDAYFSSQDPDWLQAYHTEFYRQRAALRQADLDAWLGLHSPYPPITDLLAKLSEQQRLAIATAKDGESVRLLLDRFGIAQLFPTDMILDKDTGVEKTKHLRVLAERLPAHFGEITFVDDKVNHLQQVAMLGVRVVLAGWGFNTEREHELARSLDIPVATLENAESILSVGSGR